VAPIKINAKIHPALSEVIMKALSSAPEERYQSGQDLVNDLERCKESATKTATKKSAQPASGVNAPAPAPKKSAAATAVHDSSTRSVASPASTAKEVAPPAPPVTVRNAGNSAPAKAAAAAAAAGWDGGGSFAIDQPGAEKATENKPGAFGQTTLQERASAVAETEEAAVQAPPLNVDPAMVEAAKGGTRGPSFSEISELPPLKEIYTPPPPPPVEESQAAPEPVASWQSRVQPEKPKVQPREVARKAVKEIKKTPPKLFAYSIAAALGVILLVVASIAWRIHSENSAEEGSSERTPAATQSDATAKPAWNASQLPVSNPTASAAPERIAAPRESVVVSVTPKYNRQKTKAPVVSAPAIIPGQLTINSTPEGAEVHIDGRSDPSWVTPFNLPGLMPGQHSVTVARAGYAPESRTIDVASGSKSFLVVQLAPMTAQVAVTSEPAGAQIFIDGKDSGRVTPAQISIDKPGSHAFVVKKQGYLEETTSASLQPGQIFRFAPTLKMLGSTDDIKVGGKFKKLFGGAGDTAGMGSLSIRTQPKGAQVAINNRVMDKFSPLELYLNPGTYVVDITLSGYKRIHRVIEVQKSGKIAVDENLERE
jgi:hypothetical protein